MADVREQIEGDEFFFDSAIVAHGYAAHLRDYDVVIDVGAARPDGGGSYIAARYRYRFTHCPEVHVTTAVRDDVWKASWDDRFIDYGEWERSGAPEGFVWGVCFADAYPGLSHVDGSSLASTWSERLGHEMHEISIESNAFILRLVCDGVEVKQLAAADPATGELTPLEDKT